MLPLSLYHELHVILLFAKIIKGEEDYTWSNYVSISDYGDTRARSIRNFAAKYNINLKKCESDFWTRACQLTNLFNEFFKTDILFDKDHKHKLLDAYKTYFKLRYNEIDPCTWRILCRCSTCKETKKLNFTC